MFPENRNHKVGVSKFENLGEVEKLMGLENVFEPEKLVTEFHVRVR